MEATKEIRYYLSNKQTWNDVTVQVTTKNDNNIIPSVGSVISVGKIKFRVAKVTDDRKYHKVWLEDKEAVLTPLEEALENFENLEVISIDEPIDEAAKTKAGGLGKGPANLLFGVGPTNDPSAFNWLTATGPGTKASMGGYIRSSLGLGTGFGVQVSDFGEVCIVNITYSNAQTCRCSSVTCAIILRGKNSPYAYTVYSNSARWRNCNGIDQACNFIRSKANALIGSTSSAV